MTVRPQRGSPPEALEHAWAALALRPETFEEYASSAMPGVLVRARLRLRARRRRASVCSWRAVGAQANACDGGLGASPMRTARCGALERGRASRGRRGRAREGRAAGEGLRAPARPPRGLAARSARPAALSEVPDLAKRPFARESVPVDWSELATAGRDSVCRGPPVSVMVAQSSACSRVVRLHPGMRVTGAARAPGAGAGSRPSAGASSCSRRSSRRRSRRRARRRPGR